MRRRLRDAPAFDVDLVDVLPLGWTYDASSARITTPYGGPTPVEPDSCSADTGACADTASLNVETLTWNDVVSGAGQPLDPGGTITLTFTATPQSAALTPNQATGELYTGPTNGHTNSVTVAGEDASGSTGCCDPDGPGGTPAEAYTDVDTAEVFVARADISVAKSVSPVEVDADPVNGPYWFGSYVNYTITVANDGPDAASGVTVADILDPAALEYDSVVSVDQGTFDSGTNVRTVGAIPNGESRAMVSTSSVDPNPDNDVDDDRTDVPLSVLAIDKTLDGDLEQGRRASYSLVVTNTGPSSTRGDVVVTDVLPTGLSFASVTTDRTTATCAEAGGVITCTDPEPIAVGENWTIGLTVEVSARAGAADTLATTVLTPPGILAFTGSATGVLVVISLTLMVAGGAMTALTRRRRPA